MKAQSPRRHLGLCIASARIFTTFSTNAFGFVFFQGSASPVALGATPEQAAAVSPASAASQPAAQIR